MTRKSPNRDLVTPDSKTAPMTGVATGNLGTGANLDDTQVMQALDPGEPAAHEPQVRSLLVEPEAAPEHDDYVTGSVPVSEPDAPAAPLARPVVARRRAGRTMLPARGLAGLLAVVFVVLAGLAVMTTTRDGTVGTVGSPPPAGIGIVEPAQTEGVANGRGNKGEKCRGKGNGNGNCRNDGGGGDDD